MENELVFLFGAGASFGAGHIQPSPPPLSTDLYDRLLENYPEEWGSKFKLGRYSDSFRQDFEKAMYDASRWNPSLHILEWQRTMALFFSGFALDGRGMDLYSKLLSFLQDTGQVSRSVFASLNYDCILEEAACELGLRACYSNVEAGPDVVRVLKVHGSCNFITDIGNWAGPLLNPLGHLECGMECLSPMNLRQALEKKFSVSRSRFYPVLSLYSFGKNSLVAGGKIEEIRNRWRKSVSAASDVIIIGVRPNSQDAHLWRPIQGTAARLHYIGGDHEEWRVANPNISLLGKTFADGFLALKGLLGCTRPPTLDA